MILPGLENLEKYLFAVGEETGIWLEVLVDMFTAY